MNKETAVEIGQHLKKEAHSKINDAKEAVESSNDNILSAISEVVSDFGKYLEDKKEDIADTASSLSTEYSRKARKAVKNNPLYTVGAALVAGAVIGALLNRKS